MRIAFLSDIHGNSIALDAVLQDIEARGGVDGYAFLGDYCARGFDPSGIIERIHDLPNAIFVRGNTDRYLVTGERPRPSLEDVQKDPELTSKFLEVLNSFAWTQGHVTAGGWFDWLSKLKLQKRLMLPNGARLLAVHASPRTDSGMGFKPNLGAGEMAKLIEGCNADVVVAGHTYWPLDTEFFGVRVINAGSVGLPCQPDLRASYVVLVADRWGLDAKFYRVDYDREAVIDAIKASYHPAQDYLIDIMRGNWKRVWDDSSLPKVED